MKVPVGVSMRASSARARMLIVAIIVAVAIVGAVTVITIHSHSTISSASSSGESNLLSCLVEYNRVYTGYYASDSTTFGTETTQSYNSSFTTTTSVYQSVSYVTSTEYNYTGTMTGAIGEWTISACTYTTTK